MGVCCQLYGPAALPLGREAPVPIGQVAGWAPEPVWVRRRRETIPSLPRWELNSGRPNRSLVSILTKLSHFPEKTFSTPMSVVLINFERLDGFSGILVWTSRHERLFRICRVLFPEGAGNFSFNRRIQNGSGIHPASYPMGTGDSFPGGKAAGCEADHSLPSSVEVKN
jgi:hypothetical protein